MLYRTLHNSFLLPFTPFPHTPSPIPLSSPQPLPQGMECLNSEPELEMVEEFVSGDDLFVDELLDFSELEEEQPSSPVETLPEDGKGEKGVGLGVCCVLTEEKVVDRKRDDFGGLHGSELNAEAESLESLEWLSHFVDDSFPDYSLAGKFVPEKKPEAPAPAPAPAQEQPCFATPLQTKARTKRARTGVRVWPVLSPSPVESSTSSISSSSSTTSFPPPSLWALPGDPRPAKKPKKKPVDGGVVAAQPRKCSHCGVTKTPQWRAGPLGSKTLCNACGVRFKSGRLLPEYRPACSPTFSSDLHSNNHRKVLEMRRKKETETCDAGPSQPVQSF